MSNADRRLDELIAGKYRLRHVLAEDGATWVYQATHEKLGRMFELRVLASHVPVESPDCARLLREARIAGLISHPNLRAIVDFGSDDQERPYVVYEPRIGRLLSEVIDRARSGMRLERALRITLEVIEGLRAMHHVGVVHRHLDPGAVSVFQMQSGRDSVKVAHLEDAQLVDEPSPFVGSASRRLWPGFVAPEMRRGDATVDARTDVYGAGMLLRTMLRGGGEGLGLVPIALEPVIERATDANLAARFADVTALRDAINDAVRVSELPPAPPSLQPQADLAEKLNADDSLAGALKSLRERRDTLDLDPPPATTFAEFDRMAALLAIEAIYRRFGPELWERLALRVPEVDALLPQGGVSIERLRATPVPLPLVAQVLGTADAIAGTGDLLFAAELGDAVALRGLRRVVETLPLDLGPDNFIRWIAPIWKRVMPQADVAIVDRGAQGFRFSVRAQPHPTLETCAFMAGLFRGALRSHGVREAVVHTTACQALGDVACLFSINATVLGNGGR